MAAKFSSIIENAIRLSSFWHRDQVYQNGEFDFFTHCVEVANIVTRHGFDEDAIAGAYCHDILESTSCPEDEIKTACGIEVLRIIYSVTENRLGKMSWRERKEAYIRQIQISSDKVKAICVAEQIHNLQLLVENLYEYGLVYFDDFEAGPEERLWFDDQLCVSLGEDWQHAILEEYDQVIDDLVEVMEKLNQDSEYERNVDRRKRLRDFDEPDFELRENERLTADDSSGINQEKQDFIEEVWAEKKKKRGKQKQLGKYLDNDEYTFLLPAAVSLGIKQKKITNQDLQDFLEVNYLLSYKILKEMKRLHIIDRADSFKPRRINLEKAETFLKENR